MREYETVYITKPELTESQTEQLNDRIRALIERHQGRLFYARKKLRESLEEYLTVR